MLELIQELRLMFVELREIRNEDTTPDKPSLWVMIYQFMVVYKEYIQALRAQNSGQ